MSKHPDAGVAGPKLLDPDGTVQGSARRDPSAWTGLFGRDAPLTRLFPNNPVTRRELPPLVRVGDAPCRWTGCPAPVSSCAGLRGSASDSSTSGSSSSGRMRTGAVAFEGPAGVSTTCRQQSGLAERRMSRAPRPFRSALDFHRSAYRYYRKHCVTSPFHPMILPLGADSWSVCGIRTLWAPGLAGDMPTAPRPASSATARSSGTWSSRI